MYAYKATEVIDVCVMEFVWIFVHTQRAVTHKNGCAVPHGRLHRAGGVEHLMMFLDVPAAAKRAAAVRPPERVATNKLRCDKWSHRVKLGGRVNAQLPMKQLSTVLWRS